MPWMMAQSMDLLRLHEITTAMIVPKPTPGAIYTGCVYTGPAVSVQEAKRSNNVSVAKINLFIT